MSGSMGTFRALALIYYTILLLYYSLLQYHVLLGCNVTHFPLYVNALELIVVIIVFSLAKQRTGYVMLQCRCSHTEILSLEIALQ